MMKRKYKPMAIPETDTRNPKNGALLKAEIALNVMEYMNDNTKIVSDSIYQRIMKRVGYVG